VETATPAPRESLRRFCSISSRRLGRWCNNCRPAMPMPGSMVRSDAWESGRKAAQPIQSYLGVAAKRPETPGRDARAAQWDPSYRTYSYVRACRDAAHRGVLFLGRPFFGPKMRCWNGFWTHPGASAGCPEHPRCWPASGRTLLCCVFAVKKGRGLLGFGV
jgi:hypothetical protein